jgi:hypothetical protein
MDDELCELGRTPVRVTAVPHEELGEEAELRDREVSGKRCLFALFTDYTDTYTTMSLEEIDDN